MTWTLPLTPRWWLNRALTREWGRLRAFSLQLTRCPHAADDLLQVAAERAAQKLHQLEDRARFRPWMFRILRNCHVDRLRRKDAPRVDNVIRLPGPHTALEDRRLGAAITAALEDLPESQRMAVWLVDVEELTFAEASLVLEVRPGTVASRVARGRASLRVDLDQVARERGVIA